MKSAYQLKTLNINIQSSYEKIWLGHYCTVTYRAVNIMLKLFDFSFFLSNLIILICIYFMLLIVTL